MLMALGLILSLVATTLSSSGGETRMVTSGSSTSPTVKITSSSGATAYSVAPGMEERVGREPPTPMTLPPTTSTSPPPPPPPVTVAESPRETATSPAPDPPASTSSSGLNWDSLAQCESGGNWAANTGNGYYGGLQFDLQTWQANGGSGYPHEHSRATQISVAESLYSKRGDDPWPACGHHLYD